MQWVEAGMAIASSVVGRDVLVGVTVSCDAPSVEGCSKASVGGGDGCVRKGSLKGGGSGGCESIGQWPSCRVL